jgi:hypothetical protein
MPLQAVQLIDAIELADFAPVIMQALTEIGVRSGGRYPAADVYPKLCDEIRDRSRFALVVVLDLEAIQRGVELNAATVGFCTLQIAGGDELDFPVAFLSRGWARKGCANAPFDVTLPVLEDWARQRGCRRIMTMTERASAAAGAERNSLKQWIARMAGLRAYARWIGRRGFVMRETIFEKELPL